MRRSPSFSVGAPKQTLLAVRTVMVGLIVLEGGAAGDVPRAQVGQVYTLPLVFGLVSQAAPSGAAGHARSALESRPRSGPRRMRGVMPLRGSAQAASALPASRIDSMLGSLPNSPTLSRASTCIQRTMPSRSIRKLLSSGVGWRLTASFSAAVTS